MTSAYINPTLSNLSPPMARSNQSGTLASVKSKSRVPVPISIPMLGEPQPVAPPSKDFMDMLDGVTGPTTDVRDVRDVRAVRATTNAPKVSDIPDIPEYMSLNRKPAVPSMSYRKVNTLTRTPPSSSSSRASMTSSSSFREKANMSLQMFSSRRSVMNDNSRVMCPVEEPVITKFNTVGAGNVNRSLFDVDVQPAVPTTHSIPSVAPSVRSVRDVPANVTYHRPPIAVPAPRNVPLFGNTESKLFNNRPASVASTTSTRISFTASIPKTSTRPISVMNSKFSGIETRKIAPKLKCGNVDEPRMGESRNIGIKQKLEPLNCHSMATHTTIDGGEVNWNVIDGEEERELRHEYMTKYKILKKCNSKFDIEPPQDVSLEVLVSSYKKDVRRINQHLSTANWNVITSLFYYLIEAVMRGAFKMKMFEGFGKYQYKKMYLYQQAMIELGELFTDEEHTKIAPHWRILQISATQALIFVVAGFIAKWLGWNDSSFILKMIDKAYKPQAEQRFDENGEPAIPNTNTDTEAAMDPMSTIAEMISSGSGGQLGNMMGCFMGGNKSNDPPKAETREESVAKAFQKGSDATVPKTKLAKTGGKSMFKRSKPVEAC